MSDVIINYIDSSGLAKLWALIKGMVSKKISSSDVTTITKKSQAEYDALTTKDEHTLYIIV